MGKKSLGFSKWIMMDKKYVSWLERKTEKNPMKIKKERKIKIQLKF